MSSLSIKKRVGVNVTIVIFVVISIISILAYTEFKEALERNLDYRLRSDAMSAYILLNSAHDDKLIKEHISLLLSPKTDYHLRGYAVWFDQEKTALVNSDTFKEIKTILDEYDTPAPETGKFNFTNITYKGKPCRVIWVSLKNKAANFPDKKSVNILVAISSRHAWGEITSFMNVLLLVGAISIWASVGLIMWILRWALRPIDDMAKKMNIISLPNVSSHELNIDETVLELQPFATAWDSMLNRLDKAIQQEKRFTADASHELRTPLAVMKSTLQVAKLKDRDADYYRQAIDESLTSMQRMETLIDQLLELARCQEQSLQPSKDEVNIAEILSDIAEQHKNNATQKQQNIEVDSCDTMIRCNKSQLSRAISNILANAIKYGPSNSKISVIATVNGNSLLIKVHDCGGKIAAEEIEFLFERFYRSDKVRTSSSGGVGLGLSLAKEIVNSHRGEIIVESNAKIGTVFTICLPIK